MSTALSKGSSRALSKIVEDDHPPKESTAAARRSSNDGTASDEQLRHCFVPADEAGCLGLHLSRTPWDPYPWVSGVVEGSCAALAGVRIGDCVLEANGEDLLGLKVIDIAKRVRSRRASRSSPAGVGLLLWNSGFEKNNLNPQSLSRFANCLQGIAGLLECPVCLEIIRPPSWQCTHGHLICTACRAKTGKCPICREVLGRSRCIVADKLFHYLVQTLGHEADHAPTDRTTDAHLQKESHARRLPLMLREHQRRHQQQQQHQSHHTHKHAFKLKANIGPNGTEPATATGNSEAAVAASLSEARYHCPTGQPCPRMENQHDILIHLQKSHQTGVVQHYVTAGDTVDVTLADDGPSGSLLACVVVIPRTTAPKSTHGQVFFVTKFRCPERPAESLWWLWYLGDESAGHWQVQLATTTTTGAPQEDVAAPWCGRPVSLERSRAEVLRSKQYVRTKADRRQIRVRIVGGTA
ncbi:uncharacterized protein LOC128273567 [Anopheles cruzii]|uniref:uncharacterized protein LOC128273567 n=1 Tax=Anopheles cruzii TaxID=68878 RepID=UPI0022EC1CBB|nr:uncharacterized protein LOC128273567 [Anopheles cruzii]